MLILFIGKILNALLIWVVLPALSPTVCQLSLCTAAHSCTQLPRATSCHFSTSSSGERHLCVCARTSSCSQAVRKCFHWAWWEWMTQPQTMRPRGKYITYSWQPRSGCSKEAGSSNRSYGSNLREKKCINTQRCLSFLSALCWFHSTVPGTEAPMSTMRATLLPAKFLPSRYVSLKPRCFRVNAIDRSLLPSPWLQQPGWRAATRWCCASPSSSCLCRSLYRCRSKMPRRLL